MVDPQVRSGVQRPRRLVLLPRQVVRLIDLLEEGKPFGGLTRLGLAHWFLTHLVKRNCHLVETEVLQEGITDESICSSPVFGAKIRIAHLHHLGPGLASEDLRKSMG